MNSFFEELDKFRNYFIGKTTAVAVSGGSDSLSLIFIANEWGKRNDAKFIALSVDHLLRENSTNECLYIENLMKKHNIEYHILTWEGGKPSHNIEEIARNARYELLLNFCKNNNIKTILFGHHIQDQAENFLIRLFRGSGIKGLSSMNIISKRKDINVIRPFLNLEKEELQRYLIQNKIEWIEDESNLNEIFLRNKIRNFLNSFEDKKDIVNRINSTIKIFQVTNDILIKNVNELENVVYFYDLNFNYWIVDLGKFYCLQEENQYRILFKIIKFLTPYSKICRSSKLNNFMSFIPSFSKYTISGCIFEKIENNKMVCYREYNAIKNKDNYLKKEEFNLYMQYLKNTNNIKYKLLKDWTGYKKRILYSSEINDFKR